ncbi:exodeoxyribonuclease VII large subunit [Prolixibacteraceae bacterium JC049]|nr:exodeoxyribonuclease VII large subunit [Prolixibacteraceae bacterium JC049]
MNNHITLSQLNGDIKEALSDAFEQSIWVVAEIAELKVNRNGHCYIELVEKDEVTDQILARARATIWAFTYRMIKPYFESTTGQTLTSGLKVLIAVSVEFHEVYGFSLNIKDLDPTYTLGDMAQKRQAVINQLKEDGVFDMNKELELTELPQRLAIISSPTAAGYEDFVNQLTSSGNRFQFEYQLFPATMQGDQAVESIILALEHVFAREDEFDALIIIRGGGAQLDLYCFDNYDLAYHVAQIPIPVLTGIGHEKDDSVVDMVAHTRLKTPTAVATFLIDRYTEAEDKLLYLQDSFVQLVNNFLSTEQVRLQQNARLFAPSVKRLLTQSSHQLQNCAHQLEKHTRTFVNQQHHRIDTAKNDLDYLSQRVVNRNRQNLKHIAQELKLQLKNTLRQQENKLEMLDRTRKLLDPQQILKRGYSITFHNGKLVKDIHLLKKGDEITTQVENGEVTSTIK